MPEITPREITVESFSAEKRGIKGANQVWYNESKNIGPAFVKENTLTFDKLGNGDKVKLALDETLKIFNTVTISKKATKETAPKTTSKKSTPKPESQFEDKTSYFSKLNSVSGNVIKKGTGNFAANYISWADAWNELKKIYPKSNFKVYEGYDGDKSMPYFKDDNGAFVKVGVTVEGIEHIVFLPVMDNKFNAMKAVAYTIKKWSREKRGMVDEDVQPYTMFDINRSIQRAFAKAIAMHGMGLYVYRGEDTADL